MGRSLAQSKEDSATRVLNNLYIRYQKGALKEKEYLDAVQETMQLLTFKHVLFKNKDILDIMSPYRKIVWNNNYNDLYKQEYYAILSNQAKMSGRDGQMLYYAEKMMAQAKTSRSKNSISPLMFLTDYYNGKNSYHRTLDLYKENRTYILGLPAAVVNQRLDSATLIRTGNLLIYMGKAAYHEQDSISGQEITDAINKALTNVQQNNSKNLLAIAALRNAQVKLLYEKGVSTNDRKLIWNAIEQMQALADYEGTPEYLKSYLKFKVIDNKTVFFLEEANIDSTAHYIKLLEGEFNQNRSTWDHYIVTKYKARALYNQGNYVACIDTLRRAIEIGEEFMSTTVTEASDMMYAMAKVEDQQIVLAEAEAKQKRTDQLLLLIGSGTVLLLLAGVSAFVIIRQRQQAKFLEFKLNLARNIHDEANPALLYAKTLAKAKRAGEGLSDKSELEHHIDHTMELIRSLAHDLKSDKQYSVADLISNIRATLEKLSIVGEFQYQIHEKADDKRFLSHYQFSQLKAVLQECITNTLKHAEFSRIDLLFSNQKDKLNIIYKDNGSGWSEQSSNGIGLDNMTQRIQKLNADVTIDNHYPEGYQIDLSVKLH
ncbi:sensor histidine kinase [Edaphocola aurantiacus]|uniref:hypothetical protein n=1 Tax=Edaphocola aurantiacus TaxID=2601682 RepID=UPI001C986C01|nr:hypothetical protein [Edaphocola aurantiacus]